MDKSSPERKSWISPGLRRLDLSAAELRRLFPTADPAVIERVVAVSATAR